MIELSIKHTKNWWLTNNKRKITDSRTENENVFDFVPWFLAFCQSQWRWGLSENQRICDE